MPKLIRLPDSLSKRFWVGAGATSRPIRASLSFP
jgi:hypothetical protein